MIRQAINQMLIRLLPLALVCSLSACLESKPKILSSQKANVLAVDTANSATFAFNFAYRDPSVVANPTIYLQGIVNSNTTMISTCNAAGTGCMCEFLDATDTLIAGTNATPTYDVTGNFYSCTYNTGVAALGTLAKVRLRNIASTKYSDKYTVVTTLTPQLVVGSGLDANKVRTVYRYACQYNYLQKNNMGTSPTSFSCAPSASLCGPSGDFCTIEVKFPFWVYSDNYTTNMHKQMTDLLYNAGGTNLMCNRQMDQYDCTSGTTGELTTKYFGLYADQTGIFQTPVLLNASPISTGEVYGYAAKVGTTGLCPPGMVKRDIYTASVPTIADTSVSATTATEISDPSAAPAALNVNRRYGNAVDPAAGGTGGYCTNVLGGTCFAARRDLTDTNKAAAIAPVAYTLANTPFCVIAPSILP